MRSAQSSHLRTVARPLWGLTPGAFPPPGRRARVEKHRGLILDLDDTLYPRERFVRSGFAAVANDLQRRHGLPAGLVFKTLSRGFTSEHAGREFQLICGKFGLSDKEVPYMVRVFRKHTPNLWLPYESSETLRRLRMDGWRLVILTNGLPSVQSAKVAALAVAPMVDQVVYAEAVTKGGKPNPAAFEAALERLDVSADRCVAVGDNPLTDIMGARAAGLRTIRVARPEVTVPPGCEADLVIDAIDTLPKVAGALLDMVTLDAA